MSVALRRTLPAAFAAFAGQQLFSAARRSANSYLWNRAGEYIDRRIRSSAPRMVTTRSRYRRNAVARVRTRRFAGRRSRRRRGRRFTGRGRSRRGARFTGVGRRGARLNANFSRNDRRSVRLATHLGVFSVQPAILSNNLRYSCTVNQFDINSELSDYSEFRLSNVQFVIQPLNVIKNSVNVVIATGEIPKILVRSVNPISPVLSNVQMSNMVQTPGVRYLSVNSTKRFVQNVGTHMTIESTIVDDGPADLVIQRHKAMPYMTVTPGATAHEFAAIEITRPKTVAGSVDLDYDVYVYATLSLRGNKFIGQAIYS